MDSGQITMDRDEAGQADNTPQEALDNDIRNDNKPGNQTLPSPSKC